MNSYIQSEPTPEDVLKYLQNVKSGIMKQHARSDKRPILNHLEKQRDFIQYAINCIEEKAKKNQLSLFNPHTNGH